MQSKTIRDKSYKLWVDYTKDLSAMRPKARSAIRADLKYFLKKLKDYDFKGLRVEFSEEDADGESIKISQIFAKLPDGEWDVLMMPEDVDDAEFETFVNDILEDIAGNDLFAAGEVIEVTK